jgi:hypothetical protein
MKELTDSGEDLRQVKQSLKKHELLSVNIC